MSKIDRTVPVDPVAEMLRMGAVNRELRADNERLRAEIKNLEGLLLRRAPLTEQEQIQLYGGPIP